MTKHESRSKGIVRTGLNCRSSYDAVIRIYDEAGNVIGTYEQRLLPTPQSPHIP